MSEEITVPEPYVVLSGDSNVGTTLTEPDRNVERICKAFIRLITAPESEEDLAEIPTSSGRSTTRV